MADLTTNNITTATPEADLASNLTAAASGGDTAEVGVGLFLHAANGGGTTRTITVVTPGTVDGHAIADATLVLLAGDECIIPLTTLFRGSTGRASLTYSDNAADITVAVYKLGK